MKELWEVGLFLLGWKAADIMDNTTTLQQEKIKQAQMQTEMMRLQAQVDYMKAQTAWAALEQIKTDFRNNFPEVHVSDEEWNEEFRRLGMLT